MRCKGGKGGKVMRWQGGKGRESGEKGRSLCF